MPSILLINDNSDQINWGAQATPYAIKRMLQDLIPDVTVRSLSYSWLKRDFRRIRLPLGRHVLYEVRNETGLAAQGFDTVVKAVSARAEFFPEIVDDWNYVADEWLAGRGGPIGEEFLALAREADVIVHNGENGLYKNSLTGCRSLFLLWLAKTRLGKSCCEINATAHLTSTRPVMQGMIRLLFPMLDIVTTREPCSCRNLREFGIQNVQTVPDVVFYLSETEYAEEPVKAWTRQIGLDGQAYFCLSAGSLPMSTPRSSWQGAVAELVATLKGHGLQAVLMAKDGQCLFLEEVARRTNSLFFGPEHTFDELWPLLRGARFLVTGHYHYAIMGAMVGCPFIPLSTNNHKMEGACELLEWNVSPQDSTALKYCTDAIHVEAGRLVSHRDELSNRLISASSRLRSEAAKNATLIEALVS